MLSNQKVILHNLRVDDADIFYCLYAHPAMKETPGESPFLPGETSVEFTQRISSICEYIFTIRPTEREDLVIGDCALHHWDKENAEIEIGGSLFPEYWGKGYMQAAFVLLTEMAKYKLGVKKIIGRTHTQNIKAIRLVEKMGFITRQTSEHYTILIKEV